MTARRLLPAPAPPVLRDYQAEAVARLETAVADGRRPLLVAPTASGKTVILAEIIRRRLAHGERVVFCAPRRELVTQTCGKLDDVGVEHGVLLAGADERAGLDAAVQVASVDTLVARVLKRKTLRLERFDLAIVDEAHLSITQIRTALVAELAAAVIGATAIPTRKDGRALGLVYDEIVEPATPAELTDAGYLVPARYFSWPTPDLDGIRITAADYNPYDLDQVMNQNYLVGNIVQHWLAHAAERRTVVYATSIAHAVALAEAFRRAGVAAEHVDASTPPTAREATFSRFVSGATQVLTNCFLAAYGFDLPVLSCVVLARPTRSLMLYLQMLDRGLRIAPGKRDCLVLDHSGCVYRHGFATDPRPWTLDGHEALDPAPARARPARPARECPECHAVWAGAPQCPECGFELRPAGRLVETLDGELVEINVGEPSAQDRAVFHAELRGYAAERGYKVAWAAYKFREKFGEFPPWSWNSSPAAVPSITTRRWIKSRLIAWAKSQVKSRQRVA